MEIRIFGLADDSIVDGPGVRYTVFVQGCPHHCPGCHNPASHDFAGGTLMDTDGIIRKIGENPLLDGVTLSGGQKQRIALARALAVKPGILVMDDTTSAVDMETEKYIQAQLRQLPYDCTKLIIAQRISSVKDADLILILKDGVVTERGTHQELLRQRGYYYETYCLQNGITPDTAPQEVM